MRHVEGIPYLLHTGVKSESGILIVFERLRTRGMSALGAEDFMSKEVVM